MEPSNKIDAPTQTHQRNQSGNSDYFQLNNKNKNTTLMKGNIPKYNQESYLNKPFGFKNIQSYNKGSQLLKSPNIHIETSYRPTTSKINQDRRTIQYKNYQQNLASPNDSRPQTSKLQSRLIPFSQTQKILMSQIEDQPGTIYHQPSLVNHVKVNPQSRLMSAASSGRRSLINSLTRKIKHGYKQPKEYLSLQGNIIKTKDEELNQVEDYVKSSLIQFSHKKKEYFGEIPSNNFKTLEDKEVDWTQSLIFTNKTINEKVGPSQKQKQESSPFKIRLFIQENFPVKIDPLTGKMQQIKSPPSRQTSTRAIQSYGQQIQNKIKKQNDVFGTQKFQIQSQNLNNKVQLMNIPPSQSKTFITSPQNVEPNMQNIVEKVEAQTQIENQMKQQSILIDYKNIKLPESQKNFYSRQPIKIKTRKTLSLTNEGQEQLEMEQKLQTYSIDKPQISEENIIGNQQKITKERASLLYRQLQSYQDQVFNFQSQDILDTLNAVKSQKDLLNTKYQSLQDFKKSQELQLLNSQSIRGFNLRQQNNQRSPYFRPQYQTQQLIIRGDSNFQTIQY